MIRPHTVSMGVEQAERRREQLERAYGIQHAPRDDYRVDRGAALVGVCIVGMVAFFAGMGVMVVALKAGGVL